MTNLKEKVLSFIGGGILMSGFGLIKGLTKSLSHDGRYAYKIESLHWDRQTRDLHSPERSVSSGYADSVTARTVKSSIIRTTVHSLPNWEEIFGGVEPLSVTPPDPNSKKPSAPLRPLYVDLRPWDNPIVSQGGERACTAYATVAAMENELNQAYKAKIKLSEKSLWSMYKKPHITTAIKSAKGDSATFVRLHTFNGSLINQGDWVAYINNPAALISIKKTDEILDLLAAHHPVILTTEVNQSFDEGGKGWIDPGAPSTGKGHAVTVVGYKMDLSRPHLNYFIIRNSWGSTWGDQGYGYLPINYCERFTCAGFAVKNVRLENMKDRLSQTSNKSIIKLTTSEMDP